MLGLGGPKFAGEIALYGRSGAAAAIISWMEGGEVKTEALGWEGQWKEKPVLPGMTEALWLGCEKLREKGCRGLAAVHIQVGEKGLMAECSIEMPGYFGSLKFGAGPVFVISPEALLAAAEK